MIDERQQAILDFERNFWTLDMPKELLIRERFQCSENEYYDELADLIESDEAEAHDPLVVRRLRRQRVRRVDQRLRTGENGGAS